MKAAPALILASGAMVAGNRLPELPTGRQVAAVLALAVITAALADPVPQLALGLAGLIFAGAFIVHGVAIIQRIAGN